MTSQFTFTEVPMNRIDNTNVRAHLLNAMQAVHWVLHMTYKNERSRPQDKKNVAVPLCTLPQRISFTQLNGLSQCVGSNVVNSCGREGGFPDSLESLLFWKPVAFARVEGLKGRKLRLDKLLFLSYIPLQFWVYGNYTKRLSSGQM